MISAKEAKRQQAIAEAAAERAEAAARRRDARAARAAADEARAAERAAERAMPNSPYWLAARMAWGRAEDAAEATAAMTE